MTSEWEYRSRVLVVFTGQGCFAYHGAVLDALGPDNADLLCFAQGDASSWSAQPGLVSAAQRGFRIIRKSEFLRVRYALAVIQWEGGFWLEEDLWGPPTPLSLLRHHSDRIALLMHVTHSYPSLTKATVNAFIAHHERQAMCTVASLNSWPPMRVRQTRDQQPSRVGRLSTAPMRVGVFPRPQTDIARLAEAASRIGPEFVTTISVPRVSDSLVGTPFQNVRIAGADERGQALLRACDAVVCEGGLIIAEAVAFQKRLILALEPGSQGTEDRKRCAVTESYLVPLSWDEPEAIRARLLDGPFWEQFQREVLPVLERHYFDKHVALAGPYHLERQESLGLTRQELLREVEARYGFALPRGRPIVLLFGFITDVFQQIATAVRALSDRYSVIVKPHHGGPLYDVSALRGALSGIECFVPSDAMNEPNPNLLRYAADFVLANPQSSTLTTGVLAGRRVVPVTTDIMQGDGPPTPAEVFFQMNPDVRARAEMIGPIVHLRESATLVERLANETAWRAYDEGLRTLQAKLFGRYQTQGASERVARLLLRLARTGSFQDDGLFPAAARHSSCE